MRKKLLSLVCVCLILLSSIPQIVWADGTPQFNMSEIKNPVGDSLASQGDLSLTGVTFQKATSGGSWETISGNNVQFPAAGSFKLTVNWRFTNPSPTDPMTIKQGDYFEFSFDSTLDSIISDLGPIYITGGGSNTDGSAGFFRDSGTNYIGRMLFHDDIDLVGAQEVKGSLSIEFWFTNRETTDMDTTWTVTVGSDSESISGPMDKYENYTGHGSSAERPQGLKPVVKDGKNLNNNYNIASWPIYVNANGDPAIANANQIVLKDQFVNSMKLEPLYDVAINDYWSKATYSSALSIDHSAGIYGANASNTSGLGIFKVYEIDYKGLWDYTYSYSLDWGGINRFNDTTKKGGYSTFTEHFEKDFLHHVASGATFETATSAQLDQATFNFLKAYYGASYADDAAIWRDALHYNNTYDDALAYNKSLASDPSQFNTTSTLTTSRELFLAMARWVDGSDSHYDGYIAAKGEMFIKPSANSVSSITMLTEGNGGFELKFKKEAFAGNPTKTIGVFYHTELLDTASEYKNTITQTVDGTENSNESKVSYGSISGNFDTTNFSLTLNKYDVDDTTITLSDVRFKLAFAPNDSTPDANYVYLKNLNPVDSDEHIFSTGADSNIVFAISGSTGFTNAVTEDTIFRLEEVGKPAGYAQIPAVYFKLDVSDPSNGIKILPVVDGSSEKILTNQGNLRFGVKNEKVEEPGNSQEKDYGLKLMKVDADDPSAKLEKATFALYRGNTFLGEKTTSSSGLLYYSLGGSPAGNYTLIERQAPEGYDHLGTEIHFTLDQYGKISSITNNDAISYDNMSGDDLIQITVKNKKLEDPTVTDHFTFTKNLIGRKLKAKEFTFTATLQSGNGEGIKDYTTGIWKAKNQANGTVRFPDITFTKPGTYEFSVKEEQGNAANISYSKKRFDVVVNVKEVDSKLVTDIQYIEHNGDTGKVVTKPTFNNVYEKTTTTTSKPKDPKDPNTPETGDTQESIYLFALLALVSTIAVIILHKKNSVK